MGEHDGMTRLSGKIISFNCYNLPSVMQQQLGLVSS